MKVILKFWTTWELLHRRDSVECVLLRESRDSKKQSLCTALQNFKIPLIQSLKRRRFQRMRVKNCCLKKCDFVIFGLFRVSGHVIMFFCDKFSWPLVFFDPQLSLGFLGLRPYLQYLINALGYIDVESTQDRKFIFFSFQVIWCTSECDVHIDFHTN